MRCRISRFSFLVLGTTAAAFFPTADSAAQTAFYVNPEWFRKMEVPTGGGTTQKMKNKTWTWQSNNQLLSAIAYMASGIVYDFHFYRNTPLGPLEGLTRCPRPGETGAA